MKMNSKNESVTKHKRKRLKIGYILAIVVIVAILVLGLKYTLPGNGDSKYGDRLDGIEKIKFDSKAKDAIVKKIKESDKVSDAKVVIHGKIINITFNIKKDASKDDAKAVANDSLSVISDEVKGFYDIQFIVTKKEEEGTKENVSNDDGTVDEVIHKEFPIMGYKNVKSSRIVW